MEKYMVRGGGENIERSNIISNVPEVKCTCCGKNLLDDVNNSIVIILTNEGNKIEKIIPSCKGKCDEILSKSMPNNLSNGWKEFYTFINPYLYLKHICSVMNNMFIGNGFSNEEAFESYKSIMINTSPYVMRNLQQQEINQAMLDNACPF